ncbi:MAG: class I SAM-dependent methyltransferase [Gammaproteobacteria bacterium]
MQDKIDCPVCAGQSFSHLFTKQDEPFVRCDECRLMLINPRPEFSQVVDTYDSDYSDHYIKKADKKLKRCKRWVRRIQRQFKKQGKWLDVGCSAGFVVAAAKQAGFDAYGVELEAAAVAYAQRTLGLSNVRVGVLEQQQYPDRFFDVVSLYDVIEHVPDLNSVVRELKRILKPDGMIEIRTPDVAHWQTPRDLASWKEVKPSEHLYYFSAQTLERLFKNHGLVLKKRRLMFKPALNMFFTHSLNN